MNEPENKENKKNQIDENSIDNITGEEANDKIIKREINRKLFLSLLTGSLASIAGFAGYKYIIGGKDEGGIPSILRKSHEFNENISKYYSQPKKMVPTFSEDKIKEIRVNGDAGLGEDFEIKDWKLNVYGETGHKVFTMNDIKSFKPVEMITEFKCIEGWSTIVKWKGTSLFEFLMKHQIISPKSKYIYMETPDQEYYVGLDIESAIHPQTLLAYELNNQPLTLEHGAPLRLSIPVKYGIKNIKRIGTIRVMNTRPKDYWAEQGYDWYSGH